MTYFMMKPLSIQAPKGKVGGLGYSSKLSTRKFVDTTLPDNPLYRNFVRAGSCIGLYHKRFDETKDEDRNEDEDSAAENKKKRKKKDKKKKDKKSKKKKNKSDRSVVESDPDEEHVMIEQVGVQLFDKFRPYISK